MSAPHPYHRYGIIATLLVLAWPRCWGVGLGPRPLDACGHLGVRERLPFLGGFITLTHVMVRGECDASSTSAQRVTRQIMSCLSLCAPCEGSFSFRSRRCRGTRGLKRGVGSGSEACALSALLPRTGHSDLVYCIPYMRQSKICSSHEGCSRSSDHGE